MNISPGTVVFLFSLRFQDEPESAATRCRFIASPGHVLLNGERVYAQQVYECERPDLAGQPRWERQDDKPPTTLMTEVFNRLAQGSNGQSVGVVSTTEAGNGVRSLNLGTIVIKRST